jgi:polysaccharide deacetylase 2 family uncharacterized protein YibQ
MVVFLAAAPIMAGAGLVAWPYLGDNPLGGEPVVTVALKKSQPPAAGDPSDRAAAMRESLSADADEAAAPAPAPAGDPGVVKITIHGGNAGDEEPLEAHPGEREDPTGALPPASRRRLAKAPDPGLVERDAEGALPRIGDDGRRPAQAYARPAATLPAAGGNAPPRIAVLITGLGIGAKSTDEAIRRLAEPVSLAFAPYGKGLQAWVDKARGHGHEVALQLPMEPFGYPDADPGPHTMLTSAGPAENLKHLRWLLARVTGYFAITNYMGAKFTASPQALSPILDEAARRGLAFIDDGSSPRSQAASLAGSLGLPAVTGDVVIDAGQSQESIEAALKELEALARERGQALGVATALPATIEAIARWSEGLSARGIVLTPVSALMPQRPRS